MPTRPSPPTQSRGAPPLRGAGRLPPPSSSTLALARLLPLPVPPSSRALAPRPFINIWTREECALKDMYNVPAGYFKRRRCGSGPCLWGDGCWEGRGPV